MLFSSQESPVSFIEAKIYTSTSYVAINKYFLSIILINLFLALFRVESTVGLALLLTNHEFNWNSVFQNTVYS